LKEDSGSAALPSILQHTFKKSSGLVGMNELPFDRLSRRVLMKYFVVTAILCFAFSATGLAQQTDDTPATREDVQRYFDVMHSRDMINKMVDAMLKPMHQLLHEQYLKDKERLPEDYEARMQKQMDDMMRDMPWDEIIQAEMPAFQKHLTKGDIDGIIAFYSSTTGQKLLREMPEILAESMQSMMPILRGYMEKMTDRIQTETAELLKEAQKKGSEAPVTKN
jgi:uncharacterized protein